MSSFSSPPDSGRGTFNPISGTVSESIYQPIVEGLGRILLYALLVVGLAELIKWDAAQFVGDNKFSEASYTELGQTLLLLAGSALLLYLYRSHSPMRYSALLLFGLTGAAFFREQDIYFENYIGQSTWQIPVYLLLAVVLTIVWKNRSNFSRELKLYTHSTAFGVFLAGLLTTFVFSRLFGRKTFWYAVMGDDYFRAVKNAGEECLELYGYLLLLISFIELLIFSRKLLTTNLNQSFSEIRQLVNQPVETELLEEN